MISLQETKNILNALMEKDGFVERAEITEFNYESNGKMMSEDFLLIANPRNNLAIAISIDEIREEWTIEFFGTHSHLYCATPEKIMREMYYEMIYHILRDEWAVACCYEHGSPCYGMQIACCYFPDEIEDNFTDRQRQLAKSFTARRWSGEITDEKTICYITANAEKYLKLH